MLFKGIFWGLIIEIVLITFIIICFKSCQQVVHKGTSYAEWKQKNGVENSNYWIDKYLNLKEVTNEHSG